MLVVLVRLMAVEFVALLPVLLRLAKDEEEEEVVSCGRDCGRSA